MLMKGITPFIATILLIAVTVAIGAIVTVWLSGLTASTTGTAGSSVNNATSCSSVYIDVPSVTSTAVTFGNPSTQTITNLQIIYGGSSVTPTVMNATLSSLTGGQYTSQATTRGTNASVQIKGLCQGTPVGGQCSSGQSCWQ